MVTWLHSPDGNVSVSDCGRVVLLRQRLSWVLLTSLPEVSFWLENSFTAAMEAAETELAEDELRPKPTGISWSFLVAGGVDDRWGKRRAWDLLRGHYGLTDDEERFARVLIEDGLTPPMPDLVRTVRALTPAH